ncbi:hypothetical protein IJG27_02665 [Candidatus Saccharibacteria bacterium]|nr:hypothetical protein [Candidatus Saccharibacteria bacterium]
MSPKKEMKKDYLTPALFCACIALVFTLLIVNLIFQKPNYPSISYGATTSEVEEYAYSLLSLDASSDENTAEYYLEALNYYEAQIAASKKDEQRFNLQLGFASLLGKTGDPAAGIQVLDDIDSSKIPLDAKYYLYSTYAYLYQRSGDEEEAKNYSERIVGEGIYDYIAKLDAGEIDPEEFEKESAEDAEEEATEEEVGENDSEETSESDSTLDKTDGEGE